MCDEHDLNQYIQDILDFWYEEIEPKRWFNSTPALDNEIKQRFNTLWQMASESQLSHWEASPQGCLALCILLDQFPLNMFRGEAKSFQTEQQAIDIAKRAVENGFDIKIDREQVSFLYMPLMHSEKIEDQNLSVNCFDKRGLGDNARFARHHRDLIIEFGRFPHRNELLGRENTAEEIDYLNSKRAFTG